MLLAVAFFLMKELAQQYKMNKPGWIQQIDFDSLIPENIKNKIMLPLKTDPWQDVLEIPEEYLFKSG